MCTCEYCGFFRLVGRYYDLLEEMRWRPLLAVLCCAVSIVNRGRIEGGFRSDFSAFCTEKLSAFDRMVAGIWASSSILMLPPAFYRKKKMHCSPLFCFQFSVLVRGNRTKQGKDATMQQHYKIILSVMKMYLSLSNLRHRNVVFL